MYLAWLHSAGMEQLDEDEVEPLVPAEGEGPWRQVTALIDTKKISQYDSAVTLLSDLRDLAGRDGDPVAFAKRVRELRTQYAGRSGLLQRLDRAGLPGR